MNLPWLGLGLSANLDERATPHPYRLLEKHPGLFDYVEYSAPLDVSQAEQQSPLFSQMRQRLSEVPALFHPVHLNLYGPEWESPEALQKLAEHAKAVSSPWVGNDVAFWHHRGQPFPGYLYVPPPLNSAGLADSAAHALHVQAALDVPLALENPHIAAPRGSLHVLDFMAQLSEKTGCPLVLDLAHLAGFQWACGLPLESGLDGFPLDRVIEVHIAGGLLLLGDAPLYADDHSQPVREELFSLLDVLMPKLTRLRAVTFEGDGHPPAAAALICKRLRRWIQFPPGPPADVSFQSPAPAREYEPQTRPWEVFDECYGRAPSSAAGARREVEWRWANVSLALEGAWPATWTLIASEGDWPMGFAHSTELESALAEGKGWTQAFGRYARRRALHKADETLAAVVAFESWAHALPICSRMPASGQTGVRLGLSWGEFPVDFTELYFALGAVRRHRAARGLAQGHFEGQGWEVALRQAVNRAPRGPWALAVRRDLGALSLESLDQPVLELLRKLQVPVASKDLPKSAAFEAALERGFLEIN